MPRYAWITALLCFSTLFFRLCKLCKARDYPSETLGKVWGNRLEKSITSEKLSGLFSKTKFHANICKHLVINRVNKTWNWPKFKLKAFSSSFQLFIRSNVFPFKFLWKTNICAKTIMNAKCTQNASLFFNVYFYGFCVWKAWRSSSVVNNKNNLLHFLDLFCFFFSPCSTWLFPKH